MRRASRGVQGLVVAMLCSGGLSACRDNGLADRNLPLEQARHRQYGYPVYQPAVNNVPVAVAGRNWMRSLPVVTIPSRLLVPVGNADGTAFYALRGETAPYSTLYAPISENRWRPMVRLN